MRELTEHEREASLGWRLAPLAGLAVGFLMFDFFMAVMFQGRRGFYYEIPQAISMGIFVVQIDLIALWSAMGPGRLVVRIPWALLAISIVYVVQQKGFDVLSRISNLDEIRSLMAAVLLWGLIAATGSFWVYRVVSRRRWLHRNAANARSQHFHLQHLIGGIFLLGVTFGLIKAFEFPFVFPAFDRRPIFGVGINTIVNLTITLPTLILSYKMSAMFRYLVLAGVCLLVTTVELTVVMDFAGMPSDLPGYFFLMLMYLLMNFTQGFVLTMVLSVVRWAGYELRLVTTDAPSPSKAPSDSTTLSQTDPWSEDEENID